MGEKVTEAAHEAAIDWHIRLRDAGDADWQAFEGWLAEHEAHAAAYREIEDVDFAIGPLLPHIAFDGAVDPAEPADNVVVMPVRKWRWLTAGVGLAASAAAVFAMWLIPQSQPYEVATAPGEHQIVTLDSGTRITLNGSTRMSFDHHNPRFAKLISGEALFHVRHDAGTPFRLRVGESVIEDAGTVFNVASDATELRVGVAEGKVVYNPGPNKVSLDAGQVLVTRSGQDPLTVADVPIAAVGAWQRGQLIYRGERLAQVAADMARGSGISIEIDPTIANRPFYGTIALTDWDAAQFERLGQALDVRLRQVPGGWIIEPPR